jgi:hypothetical protein
MTETCCSRLPRAAVIVNIFRLLAAGAVPVAFVLGTCVYHIAHQGVLQSLRRPTRIRR